MKQITVPNALRKLAEVMETELKNRRLDIPTPFGKGYSLGFVFNEHIRMLINNFELHQDIKIKNQDTNISGKILFF